jgi:hypothetical protein
MPLTDGTFKNRLYTPDFVVRLRDGRVVIVEVKASVFTTEEYWRSREHYIRDAYARDYALELLVVTERQIRIQPRLSNYEQMLRYGARTQDDAADAALRDYLARAGMSASIGDVGHGLALRADRIRRSIAAVMRFALHGEISLDLDQPLSLSTKIVALRSQ